MRLDVLVIDDEQDIRHLISDILNDAGFSCRVAADSTQAFEAIAEKVPSAIILDVWLQGSNIDGLGILENIKKKYPLLPVIVISGHGTIETAVSAIKMGAYDYLEKPFTHDKLIIMLKRACESARLKRENFDLKTKVIDKTELVGQSNIILKLKSEIERVAPTSGRIMITGATGSGKELAARLIHKKSKRANGPFIIFSPTGMSSDRVMQELFSEPERHDINNMFVKRNSALEAANNGTLYIDEVGDLPINAQTRLLKFLQDQIIEKGINKSIKLDVRIITSTSKNLHQEIANNNFRQDLFYRLNVVPIRIPALSERKEDIAVLSEYFIKHLAKSSGLKDVHLSDEIIAALQAYSWPGNVRELRNVIERMLIMNPVINPNSNVVKTNALPSEIASNSFSISKFDNEPDIISMTLREAREIFEKHYLSAQMDRCGNNISKTSKVVGMERSALHRKLKSLNIHFSSSKNKDLDQEDEIEVFKTYKKNTVEYTTS